jgi:S-DNA-T family DNA segregation ATPase FtsK/SpoIIIE
LWPAAAVLAAVVVFRHQVAAAVIVALHVLVVAVGITAVAGVVGLVVAVVRFARLSPAARRNWHRAVLARARWRWLTRNLGLAYTDAYGKRKMRNGFNPAKGVVRQDRIEAPQKGHVRYPRARIRPADFGITARVKVIPHAGRLEFEQKAQHIADQWRCARIGVTQVRPGRLLIRGLARDPLTDPLAVTDLPVFDGRHITLGRDEFGDLRAVDLASHSGSVWSGQPGRGKTEAGLSLAAQLVPSPLVDFWVLDGGANDWAHFAGGAAGYVADDLAAAVDLLLELDGLMRTRRRNLEVDLGVRNAWKAGLSEAYRLQWLIVEEAPFYLSLDSVKGDRKREAQVLACRGLAGNLLRRGRAPAFHTSLVAQKPSTGSLPPDLRDLAGLRWSFGCATIENAVSCLGEDIRQHATMQPTLLQGPEHVGVATALLRTASSPYTLVKFPAVGEQLADQVAEQAAQRRAPCQLVPVPS